MQHHKCRSFATILLALAALPSSLLAQQQPATISGRVTTAAGGGPVNAATVAIPSLNVGAITNAEGRYTFTVPAARVTGQTVAITARSVGYAPVTEQVTLQAGPITQDFVLTAGATQLSAVVVTGAGTSTRRERLGATINTVDSGMIQRATQPQNLVSALAGAAPNVDVRTQSGEPGASASIRIRGATSVLGTNEPLFVIDNQPVDNSTISTTGRLENQTTVTQNRISDLNPNDIESVEILKGAAASAIYGARAANGVVLITTKRGRAGDTRYTWATTATFDEVEPAIDLQRRFGQGSGGVGVNCPEVNCRPASGAWGPEIPAGTPTYDQLNSIFDTGVAWDNNLTISGGSERTTFFLSGGLMNQEGYMEGPNNDYNRTTVRLKATHELLSNLTVGGNFSYIDTRGSYVQKGSNTSGLLLGALRSPPDFNNRQYLDPETGLHRSYRFPRPGFNSLTMSRGYDNPFFTLNNPGNWSELGRYIGNINLDWRPLEWLQVQYTLGADSYSDSRTQALPFTSSDRPTGEVIRFDVSNLQIDHNLVVTGTREFSPNFSGRLLVGQNLNSRRYRDVFSQGNDLNAPEPLALQNTINPLVSTETRSLRHVEGYFAQAEADFYNQLFLTVGVRNDGYSTFGESDRRATYPKAQLSWMFTNLFGEGGTMGPLTFGKLRAAYGEVGREPPVYATITAYDPTTLFGSGFGDFVQVSQSGQGGLVTDFTAGNPELKPERNKEFELGFDIGLFGQLADLSFTYFDKQSEDVILQVPVNAGATGTLFQLANAAEISNKGVEVQLNLRPVTTDAFAWDLGLQYGRTRGRVESLAGAEFVNYNLEGFTGSIGSSTVGFAPGVIRGQDFVRCGRGLTLDIDGDNVVEDIDALCGAGAPRNALFINAEGIPVADPTDRVIADPNPEWMGGLTTQLTFFRRLRVSALLDVREGFEVWNGTKSALLNFGTHKDTEIRTQPGTFGRGGNWYTHEQVAGPGAGQVAFENATEWQGWFNGLGGSFGPVASQFIEDGSFVKLREVSVAFTFDQPWVRSVGLSSIDARIAGRNLATWTDYTGLDPEASLGGAEYLTQGIDFFNNPQSRSFVLSFTFSR